MSISRLSPGQVQARLPLTDREIKPQLRGWMHLGLFEVSLVVGTLLIAAARGPRAAAATSIYAASVSCLFGASALYHRGNWSPVVKRWLQGLDHAMIFVLFAGSATPFFLLAVPGSYGVLFLILIWSLAAAAAAVHLFQMHAPDWVLGLTLTGLGGVGALCLPGVWQHVGVLATVLVVTGAVLYVVGAAALHRHRPDPWPAVFGYHEVFHAFVGAAAACHYVAIALVVL